MGGRSGTDGGRTGTSSAGADGVGWTVMEMIAATVVRVLVRGVGRYIDDGAAGMTLIAVRWGWRRWRR